VANPSRCLPNDYRRWPRGCRQVRQALFAPAATDFTTSETRARSMPLKRAVADDFAGR
jgi:hypothetical protein